ncbi:MAG: hypothetical protein GC181_08210 [Bacteroidetes bacterium]|nr:hypothetical protein [Bacteroidota bacterium]
MKSLFNKTYILSLLIVSTISFHSCKEEDDNTTPTTSDNDVTITIDSPVAYKTYMFGDTVKISGNAKWNQELHGYVIQVKNVSADSIVFTKEEDVHSTEFSFNTQWINDVTMHSDMQLIVTIEKDHEGNSKTSTVDFHCHPKM